VPPAVLAIPCLLLRFAVSVVQGVDSVANHPKLASEKKQKLKTKKVFVGP
jgi:hypothetical protein